MAMNASSFTVSGDGAPATPRTLNAALESARELAHAIASLPEDAPETRHPSYCVVRGLAYTILDMLEEIAEDEDRKPVGSEKRLRQDFR